jgi:pyrimidine-nucleoside phosphorylase
MRVGLLAAELGAGRRGMDDVIEPKAGIVFRKKVGDKIEKDEPFAVIYTDRSDVVDRATRELTACISVSPSVVERRSCVRAFVDMEGVRPWISPQLI